MWRLFISQFGPKQKTLSSGEIKMANESMSYKQIWQKISHFFSKPGIGTAKSNAAEPNLLFLLFGKEPWVRCLISSYLFLIPTLSLSTNISMLITQFSEKRDTDEKSPSRMQWRCTSYLTGGGKLVRSFGKTGWQYIKCHYYDHTVWNKNFTSGDIS